MSSNKKNTIPFGSEDFILVLDMVAYGFVTDPGQLYDVERLLVGGDNAWMLQYKKEAFVEAWNLAKQYIQSLEEHGNPFDGVDIVE
jgi:hypothetical protein